MDLFLYNTLSKEKEKFEPLKKGLFSRKEIGLYTCGPTVYNYAHIGNLRTYIFEDILKRTLEYNIKNNPKYKGYSIKHVMNITDVGHLTDDADSGEDKLEKGAKREGKTAWEIAEFYTKKFQENLHDLNIEEPNIWCRATDHIPEQIKLVQKLIDKGVTYETNDGIYFDTTKIDDYGKLANLKNQTLQAGTRVELGEKKNPHDFALWKFSQPNEKRQMEWNAFGKKGFPGWHIECSAMSMKYLGEQFDIHCGGIDHVPIHHTNEIAQSETVTSKKPWVKYWMHGEFLVIGNPSSGTQDKMAKSSGNFITLDTLKEKKINPLAYRYFLLQTHYRKQLNFSWEALEAAQTGLNNLYKEASKYIINSKNKPLIKKLPKSSYEHIIVDTINSDLDTPQTLSVFWTALKNLNIPAEKTRLILVIDELLGLKIYESAKLLKNTKKEYILHAETGKFELKGNNKKLMSNFQNIKTLMEQRQKARQEKNWAESDRLRDEIKKLGYSVEDTSKGQKIKII